MMVPFARNVDAPSYRGERCKAGGKRGLTFKPMRKREDYQPFAECPRCGNQEEL
jgi:hypothetical protein